MGQNIGLVRRAGEEKRMDSNNIHLRYIGKPDAADSKATNTSSSVPNTESATSEEALKFSRY